MALPPEVQRSVSDWTGHDSAPPHASSMCSSFRFGDTKTTLRGYRQEVKAMAKEFQIVGSSEFE
jgi:hypothetical protein